MNDTTNGYKYILAYGIAIAIFAIVIKTKIGYNTIYYMLLLALIFVLLSQSKFIADSLKPLSADLIKGVSSKNV